MPIGHRIKEVLKINYATHTTGGVAAGLLASSYLLGAITPQSLPIFGAIMVGSTLGSLLPDIDHGKSYISGKLPIIGMIVSAIFKHRGVLHTPLINIAWVAILLASYKSFIPADLWSIAYYVIISVGIGYLSHLILDTCNVQGIMWLYPISSKRFHILGITTGSIFEKIFATLLVVIIIYIFSKEYVSYAVNYLK